MDKEHNNTHLLTPPNTATPTIASIKERRLNTKMMMDPKVTTVTTPSTTTTTATTSSLIAAAQMLQECAIAGLKLQPTAADTKDTSSSVTATVAPVRDESSGCVHYKRKAKFVVRKIYMYNAKMTMGRKRRRGGGGGVLSTAQLIQTMPYTCSARSGNRKAPVASREFNES